MDADDARDVARVAVFESGSSPSIRVSHSRVLLYALSAVLLAASIAMVAIAALASIDEIRDDAAISAAGLGLAGCVGPLSVRYMNTDGLQFHFIISMWQAVRGVSGVDFSRSVAGKLSISCSTPLTLDDDDTSRECRKQIRVVDAHFAVGLLASLVAMGCAWLAFNLSGKIQGARLRREFDASLRVFSTVQHAEQEHVVAVGAVATVSGSTPHHRQSSSGSMG